MNRDTIVLTGTELTLNELKEIVFNNKKVSISDESISRIKKCRKIVEDIVKNDTVKYGINTGFGKFSDIKIDKDETKELQKKIVLSHSVGIGKPFSEEVVRGMMLLKLNSFAPGYSGVRLELAETLRDMLNKGVHPVIPEKGSVGASGDLAPLSHMALVVIGEGEAFYKGKRMSGKLAMEKAGIKIVELQAKEGLALLNGTQAMASLLSLAVIEAERVIKYADITGACSLEALKGTLAAFDEKIHLARPHSGQIYTAKNYKNMLGDGEIIESHKDCKKVQDAYSIRCIPQVHGAIKDTFRHVKSVIETEINSVTDNPLVFPDEEEVISGGNFHGEPLALVSDFMAIALSELANISERRIEYLLDSSTNDGLPAFLIEKGGLNSGYMMAQVTAAALVSENKVLSHPSSVDSIPTSANKEDHVSMGTYAARKLNEVTYNVKFVLAIEMLCSIQGLDLNLPLKPAKAIQKVYDFIREKIPYMKEDRNIHLDINKMNEMLSDENMLKVCEEVSGELLV